MTKYSVSAQQPTANTPPASEHVVQNVIALGRAYVRLVESANALLERKPFWTERLLLRMVRALYSRRLREMVGALPANVTAEILAGSDKMSGVVQGFSHN